MKAMKQTIITTYKKIYAGHTDLIMCFVLIILVLFSSALPAQATPECQRLRSQAACISKFSNPPVHVNGAQMPRGNASWLVMVFQSVGWLSVFASHFLYGLANRGCSHASFNEWLLHFPASGLRNNNDGWLGNVGNNGYYWSAVPNNTNNGCNLNFNSGNVNPLNNNTRTYGFAVRAVSEFTAWHVDELTRKSAIIIYYHPLLLNQ